MKMRFLILLLLSNIITGCNNIQNYSGNNEYAELTHRNIVYRDLTKTVSEDNLEEVQIIKDMPTFL